MKNQTLFHAGLLILTALIWGVAFVAQSEGGDAVGPYTFNCIRSLIGAAVLTPVIRARAHRGKSAPPASPAQRRQLLRGGVLCGVALCVASNLQQLGINLGTSAGKAGFLTACYLLLVPILGLPLKKHCAWNTWIGVGITLIGLYLLCINGGFRLQFSDLLLLLCALVFAIQILAVDYFAPLVDGVRLSRIQLLVTGVLTAIPMLAIDLPSQGAAAWCAALLSWDAWIPILYAGVMSCGVAYTLQIIGQQGVSPTVASLLMSLESVFSVLAGWVLLHQALSARELAGCALIFAAVIFAQLPLGKRP
ncbi:MAG: DMT family transporter [Oscillospiraceae bacterium]|nr:DMT family transporter [Oscillospiraceae bacterium]